ncbi:hypothetical protein F2Q70_00017094 [Brassica cretica]|uniref:Uncharacterized protein n=1 Tax=Brassica cretica TaxID=69181 RepID=A0A8S9HS29_BRACR|nr:hypothetical protein F2Q70_00017094 [Brassica cretica]
MVATLVLIQDATGNLHDQEGHLCNAAGQKIDDQRTVIPDSGPVEVDGEFNGKIDVVYSELDSKFESLKTHVRKLETQVVQTVYTIKRHEDFLKGKGDESLKYHVNAIMDDNFWQVVKEEKLQEGDFQVESFMSFGGSHWCRSTPSFENRLTEAGVHRSTSISPHRSTEEVVACVIVRILTHEEFAAKHPHPPKPFCIKKSDIN